jgi:transcription antitermination factor NusG
MLGWPSPESLRQEGERVRPDAVSAERARRKRGQRTSQHATERARSTIARGPDQALARPAGERVRVRDGTFAGMEGVVREILDTRGAVRVELTIFGRPVPVELEYWQVEQASE